jgi:glycosyltransferase involved in cell wall biosynthesis
MNKPMITVITVCYNSGNKIQDTIESVAQQNYNNLEYIVVDGGSKDNTIDIIKKYLPKFNGDMRWISEPDDGVYDAMNKGIKKSNGEWIIFINAGDSLYSKDILNKIFINDNDIINNDVIYGKVNVKYSDQQEKIVSPKDLNELWKGMIFCHQSAFIRSNIMKKYMYDLNYEISADFDFFYKLFNQNYIFKEVDYVISNYEFEGISNNRIKNFYEKKEIVLSNTPKTTYKFFYTFKIIEIRIRELLKKILPSKLVRKIQLKL